MNYNARINIEIIFTDTQLEMQMNYEHANKQEFIVK